MKKDNRSALLFKAKWKAMPKLMRKRSCQSTIQVVRAYFLLIDLASYGAPVKRVKSFRIGIIGRRMIPNARKAIELISQALRNIDSDRIEIFYFFFHINQAVS